MERVDELTQAISNIGAAAGDGPHTRGVPGYVVRFGEPRDVDAEFHVENVFLVLVEAEGATVLQRVRRADFVRVTELPWDDHWFDAVVAAFATFRASLEAS
jgi:hypothetical protein